MFSTPFTHVYAAIVSTNCAWFIQEQVNKLLYTKLQYPTYVKTLTLMFTLKYSSRPIKLIVNLWKLTLSTYLVSFSKQYLRMEMKILFKFIQVWHLKNWRSFLANGCKPWKMTRKSICNYKIFNSKLLNVWSFTNEHLFKLMNFLQVKATYVFFTTIFK
jgi:hypothetical protein